MQPALDSASLGLSLWLLKPVGGGGQRTNVLWLSGEHGWGGESNCLFSICTLVILWPTGMGSSHTR